MPEEENSEEEKVQKNETILYCFPREATRKEDISNLKNVLEEEGYSLSVSEGEGENILIQREASEEEEFSVGEIL